MPKNGSGRSRAFNCAATTVLGMDTGSQSLGWNAGVEIVSPVSLTFAEVCRDQPSRRAICAGEEGDETCAIETADKRSRGMAGKIFMMISNFVGNNLLKSTRLISRLLIRFNK